MTRVTSIKLFCALLLLAFAAGSIQAQEIEDSPSDGLIPAVTESAPSETTPIPFIPAGPTSRSNEDQPTAPPRQAPVPTTSAREALPAPSELSASVRSAFVVHLSWTDNGGDADRAFHVAISADGAAVGNVTIQPDHNPNTNRVITEIIVDRTRVRYCFELWAQSGPSLRSDSVTECLVMQPPSRQTAPPGRGRPWR